MLEYLEETVLRVPEKLAFADDREGLTFCQVYRHSRAIGSCLAAKGYYGEPVAVLMGRRPDAVATFFGCVYAGCFYVPLDEQMPSFRLSLILKELNPRVLICNKEIVDNLDYSGEILDYNQITAFLENEAVLSDIRRRQVDTDPVYVVYTSGSTGVPKGVVACHRSIIDYIENLSNVLNFNADTVFGNQSPLYFDACLKELYPTIKYGATTYLIPRELFSFPVRLVAYLNDRRINTICWVASALTLVSSLGTFERVKPQYLHTVAFGSEVFPVKQLQLWKKALPHARFTNLYGPTECTGMSCYYHVGDAVESIPIGHPFPNTRILLLTAQNTPAAKGEVGEICIGGTCLTLGYYGNFEKTNEVFVQNPLNHHYSERIYRTGDLGRWNSRGELEFVCRKDHQIKHMGHRIELLEIEVNTNRLEGIRLSCCVYHQPTDRVLLYYTGNREEKSVVSELLQRLPRYMVPNRVFRLDTMPLTANGKLDRVALQQRFEGEMRCE